MDGGLECSTEIKDASTSYELRKVYEYSTGMGHETGGPFGKIDEYDL